MAENFPTVSLDDNALHAVNLIERRRLPGVVVVGGESGRPVAVLPGSQVLRFIVPYYVQEDLPASPAVADLPASPAVADLPASPAVADLPASPAVDSSQAE